MIYVEVGINLLMMSVLGSVILSHMPNMCNKNRKQFWLMNFAFIFSRQIIGLGEYLKIFSNKGTFMLATLLSIVISLYFIRYIHKNYKPTHERN